MLEEFLAEATLIHLLLKNWFLSSYVLDETFSP